MIKGLFNRAVFFPIAFLALEAAINASPSYNVLVAVVDSNTGQPVEGATVSTREIVAVTGKDGRVMLKASSGDSFPVEERRFHNVYFCFRAVACQSCPTIELTRATRVSYNVKQQRYRVG